VSAPAARFAIVAARWNEKFVQRLVDGALDTLRREGVSDDRVELSWVPGSHE
jgi:6,7-dimethyl-8-ribityllumazine synthase